MSRSIPWREVFLGAEGKIWDTRTIRYRYDKAETGDGDSWKFGAATRVLTQGGSGWSTTLSLYDSYGYWSSPA